MERIYSTQNIFSQLQVYSYNVAVEIVLLISVFLSSCKEQRPTPPNQDISIAILKGVRVSPLIDSLFRVYHNEVANAPAYAICIDKKSEGLSDYVITIAPFSKKINTIYESGALNYFMFNDSVPVVIYSGLEDFLTCDTSTYLEAKKISAQASGEFKNIDFFVKLIDFSKGLSYVHFDTNNFIVRGNAFPFGNVRLARSTVSFDKNMLPK